jgi:C4-dicarboxylate transporter DctM subunit
MSSLTLAGLIFACMLGADGHARAHRHRDVRGRLLWLHLPGGHGTLPQQPQRPGLARFASYDLSVIPLFILMGNFATQGGISKALFQFASAVMARFRGGLAMAAVMASAAFGAICGSSIATAATITSVALPEMKRHGYSGRLATGTLAAGGTLGILIPPSVPLVIYAILTEQNIAKLFAAATIPGVIAMFGYMIAIAVYVRLFPATRPSMTTTSRASRRPGRLQDRAHRHHLHDRVRRHLWRAVHPTEGAGVGAAATFVAALLQARADAPEGACTAFTPPPAPAP